MEIKGVANLAAAAAATSRAGVGAGFALPAGAEAVAAKPAAAAAGLDTLLALQEWDGGAARDRQARKHGRAMLAALARLQLGLLGDDPDGAALAELAALAEHCPEAADPALRDALADVGLRARIEVARRAVAAPPQP